MFRRHLAAFLLLALVTMTASARPESLVMRISGEGFEGVYVIKVPDASQPPPNPLRYQSLENWCAPLAAANAIVFLDQVAEAEWALDVSGGLPPDVLSAYLAHFMATNGEGSEDRQNAISHQPGTLTVDLSPGIADFAAWPGEPPPDLLRKEQRTWEVDLLLTADIGDEAAIEAYATSIDAGMPAILCFAFWNPVDATSLTLSSTAGDDVIVSRCLWGDPIASTEGLRKADPTIPTEQWDEKWGVGHAVTGVGLLKDEERLWVVVHDNWSTTAEDVVVPWEHVAALIRLLPR